MKLEVQKRTSGKKGKTNQLRREGKIPAILYGLNQQVFPIQVNGDEMKAILREIKQGLLPTTQFELTLEGKKHKAIVKEIQYQVASYEIEHIDFMLLADESPVTVNVPIQLIGAADCAGVKLGGFIRQVIRSLKVSCLPKHIPQEFTLDVRELNIAESRTLGDIQIPSNVRPIARLSEVAVVVGKKAGT